MAAAFKNIFKLSEMLGHVDWKRIKYVSKNGFAFIFRAMAKMPLYSNLTNNGCYIENNIKHSVKIRGFLLLHNLANTVYLPLG